MTHADPDAPKLSIIIVNYHSWDKLHNCLNSLAPEHQSGLALEIIVVDNDPEDPEMAGFATRHPKVKFIKNEGNLGFAHGCNTGALVAKGSVFLFLNPDTIVPDGVIERMLSTYQTLPQHAILSTNKVNGRGKTERIQRFFPKPGMQSGLGKALHRLLNRQALKEAYSADKTIVYPEWVSGSVVMIGRDTFTEIHGWDTSYWMYSEDADLCKRVLSIGGQVALNQQIDIVHDHGGSSRINHAVSALTKSEVKISHHVFISRHFTGFKRLVMHTELLIVDTISSTLYMLLSLIFFSSSKLKTKRLLWVNLVKYYLNCIQTRQWLSPRSIGKDSRI